MAKKRTALSGKAPVLWKFKTRKSALGIYIDDERCWVGDEGGNVYALDHDATVERSYELPEGVKALVSDERWIYAGCDDGQVYDLSRRVPTVAYEISKETMVFWLEIFGGTLCVSDSDGRCSVYDHEGEKLWSAKSPGPRGWMVRADRAGVYHGVGGWFTGGSVSKYSWKGKKQWTRKTSTGGVGFGWQEQDRVYASTTSHRGTGGVHSFNKKTGRAGPICRCDDPVLSCATSPNGKHIFAGDQREQLYCFEADGTRIWKLSTGCGSAQSMQFHAGKLFVVTHKGFLACIDASEAAIQEASSGKVPKARQIRAPSAAKARRVGDALQTAAANATGVVVRCVKIGGRIRVQPVSPGYKPDWNVQFPHNLRADGALYLVEALVEASQGNFYRAVGEIHRTNEAALKQTQKATKKKATKKKASKKKATKKKATKKKASKKKAAKKKPAKKKAAKKKPAKKKAAKKKTAKKISKKKASKKKPAKKKPAKKKQKR